MISFLAIRFWDPVTHCRRLASALSEMLSKDHGIFPLSPLLLTVTESPSSTELLNFLHTYSSSVTAFCLCLLYPFLPKLAALLLTVPCHPYYPPMPGFLFTSFCPAPLACPFSSFRFKSDFYQLCLLAVRPLTNHLSVWASVFASVNCG